MGKQVEYNPDTQTGQQATQHRSRAVIVHVKSKASREASWGGFPLYIERLLGLRDGNISAVDIKPAWSFGHDFTPVAILKAALCHLTEIYMYIFNVIIIFWL